MTKGAVIYEKGSPDVFKWENIDVPDPKFDEVLIKNTAVGVNYIAVSYTHLTLPTTCTV